MQNQKSLRVILATSLLSFFSFHCLAQIPAGYYDNANGQSGYTLKTTLHNIINDHNDQGYGALWGLYENSDKRADGKVWDIYSDCDLTFGVDPVGDQDEGSGGTVECDKFNREHTFPQSWFDKSNPMRNDPFHVLPTDKRVNSVRGNFAYGEVSNPSFTSLNGSKLGPNTISGHSGTVFEPIDEYKGDIARGYLYMATRYEDLISGWENNNSNGDAMLDGSADQVYEDWALNMLLSWHNADPVSQKEIDRNEAIYDFQANRNPFIDHPEYVASIWSGTPSPIIDVTASLTDFGIVAFGEVSDSQSYTVSGADLTNDINITATNGFEVSLTDAAQDFATSIILTQSSGTVSTTTIFVRFKPESDLNGVVNGVISHTSTGANSTSIDVSGFEKNENAPNIDITSSLTSFGAIPFGEVSDTQSYSVAGFNLTNDISITANSGFEISLTDVDQDFTTSVTLTHSSGTVSTTTIFVRFKPESDLNGVVNGTISHSSAGATDQTINVTGSEYDIVIPEVNFSFSSRIIDPVSQYEVELFADIAPNDDLTILIENTNSTELTYDEHFTTEPILNNGILELTWPAGELNTTFSINLETTLLNATNPGTLEFQLVSEAGYTIGTNNQFVLTLRGDETITSTIDIASSDFRVYPNPANTNIIVDWAQHSFNYLIADLTGKVLKMGEVSDVVDIDISILKPGNYLLSIFNNEASVARRISVY